MRIKFSILVLSIAFIACNSQWDDTLLHGDWKVYDWTLSNGQKINQTMNFSFKSDKNYEVDYGSEKEVGTWYLAGEFLHTKENGSLDKSVRIIYLAKDTLQFEMNRAGSLELLTLFRP